MAAGGSGGSNGEAAEFDASQPKSTFYSMACVLVLDGPMASELAAREAAQEPCCPGPAGGRQRACNGSSQSQHGCSGSPKAPRASHSPALPCHEDKSSQQRRNPASPPATALYMLLGSSDAA